MNEKFYTYNMSDPYVIMIQILSTAKKNDADVTDKVRIYQMSTDPALNPLEAIVKNSERECGLYEALDTASVWLEKALA